MKNIGKLALLGAVLAASASSAFASFSVNGLVYEGQPGPNVLADPGGVAYALVPTDTFILTNASSTGLFNFYSANDGPGAVGGLTSFLTTSPSSTPNGNTVTGITPGTANDSINNDLFQFMGTTMLLDQNYTFTHDDGLLLYIDGILVINDGAPTSAETTNFNVVASGVNNNSCTTGGSTCTFVSAPGTTHTFTLDYAEVDGAPAQLTTNLPLFTPVTSTTPEPNSLVLLGTGLLGAAGMLFRRTRAA